MKEYTKLEKDQMKISMPYLEVRNVWTDSAILSNDIHGEELPSGWMELFLQMCEDIRQPLIDANFINSFRFSQIKEKWGSMVCYTFGAPEIIQKIILKYEHMSGYVCSKCGKPASIITVEYILPFCKECAKNISPIIKTRSPQGTPTQANFAMFASDSTEIETYDCSSEWERYCKRIESILKS